MNFYQIRLTMTDDAYDIVSAFGQTPSLTLRYRVHYRAKRIRHSLYTGANGDS